MKPLLSIIAYIKIIIIKTRVGPNCKAAPSHACTNVFQRLMFIFIPLTSAISQTAIVVSRVDGIVYIAADSRGKKGRDVADGLFCKIKRINNSNYYFANAGIYEDPNTGFYLPDIVNQSFNPERTLQENIINFEQNVIPNLKAVLTYKKAHYPENYRAEYIQDKGRPLSIVFAGVERDSIAFHIRYFNIFSHDPPRIEIRRTSCPGNCTNGKGLMPLGGLSQKMKDWFDDHENEFWKMGIVDGMRKLIEVAIKYDSTEAAHPINIIQISSNGVRWIDPKPPCAE